jgi:hypothetical protein
MSDSDSEPEVISKSISKQKYEEEEARMVEFNQILAEKKQKVQERLLEQQKRKLELAEQKSEQEKEIVEETTEPPKKRGTHLKGKQIANIIVTTVEDQRTNVSPELVNFRDSRVKKDNRRNATKNFVNAKKQLRP